jgi:hypothetical protein
MSAHGVRGPALATWVGPVQSINVRKEVNRKWLAVPIRQRRRRRRRAAPWPQRSCGQHLVGSRASRPARSRTPPPGRPSTLRLRCSAEAGSFVPFNPQVLGVGILRLAGWPSCAGPITSPICPLTPRDEARRTRTERCRVAQEIGVTGSPGRRAYMYMSLRVPPISCQPRSSPSRWNPACSAVKMDAVFHGSTHSSSRGT